MGSYIRFLILSLVVFTGACSKQAPKKEQIIRTVTIYPGDYIGDVYYDPQDYDIVDEQE